MLQQQLQTIKLGKLDHIFGRALRHAYLAEPDKMNAYNVAFSDIRSALNSEYRIAARQDL